MAAMALMEALLMTDILAEVGEISWATIVESLTPARLPGLLQTVKAIGGGAAVLAGQPIIIEAAKRIKAHVETSTTPGTTTGGDMGATGKKRAGSKKVGPPGKRLRFDDYDPNDLPGEVGTSESSMTKRPLPVDMDSARNDGKRKNSSSNEASHGEEVPVMPIYGPLSKVVPNFYTVNLPHEEVLTLNAFSFKKTNSTPVCRIRLNSIYDPIVGSASNVQPQGRDLWASHFKYYRVLHSRIMCTVISVHRSTLTTNTADYGYFNFGYELLDQDQTLCGDMESFLVAKHCKRSLLRPAEVHQYWNGTSQQEFVARASEGTFVYNYSPGEWNYHVREQGSEERWTPILQNPSIDHDLAVRLFHHSSTDPQNTTNMKLLIGIQYTVQFMEEKEEAYKVRDSSLATYGGAGEDAADD